MCIVSNCLSHEWLTFLKRCYWPVKQKYNKHVTIKSSFLHKPKQKHNDLHCNSNEFSNRLFYLLFAFPKFKGRLVPNSSTIELWGRIWDVTFCFVPKFRPTRPLNTSSAPVFLWTSERRMFRYYSGQSMHKNTGTCCTVDSTAYSLYCGWQCQYWVAQLGESMIRWASQWLSNCHIAVVVTLIAKLNKIKLKLTTG